MIIKHTIQDQGFKVFISNQLLERLYEIANEFFPKEFGGILTGYRGENHMTIVDFEMPAKYEISNNQFVRHADDLNHYLKTIYDHSDGHFEYLGEWHSHPNSSANYSSNDLKSMVEIATDSKIKVKNPLLIILSMTRRANSYKLYQIQEGKIVWFNNLKLL